MEYMIKGIKFGTITKEQGQQIADMMRYGTGSQEHLYRHMDTTGYRLNESIYSQYLNHCHVCGVRFTRLQKPYVLHDERATVCKHCFNADSHQEPQELNAPSLAELIQEAVANALADYEIKTGKPFPKPKAKNTTPQSSVRERYEALKQAIHESKTEYATPDGEVHSLKSGTARVSHVKPLKRTKVLTNTMTYSPFTVETMFRIIPRYSQYLKPRLIPNLLRIIEAEGDIVIQHDLQETSQCVGLCRYTKQPALCITHVLPYTEQGLHVVDSAIVVKSWHWKVNNNELQRSEVMVSVNGECLDHLPQHFYWLGAKVKH